MHLLALLALIYVSCVAVKNLSVEEAVMLICEKATCVLTVLLYLDTFTSFWSWGPYITTRALKQYKKTNK